MDNKGFTLLETMVVLVITTIFVFALPPINTSAGRSLMPPLL